MLPFSRHGETHLSSRAGMLRASVLGADDGIVSTASLVLGVAAANGSRSAVLAAGVAGLVAGALSMAAGEYVSVASQRDVEEADVERERSELAQQPEAELEELVRIYTGRGLTEDTARRAARELTEHDPLGAHVRDELGLVSHLLARPWQAAGASAAAFSAGGLIPILVLVIAPSAARTALVVVTALAALALLGTLGAVAGGAARRPAAARVLVGGAVAMAATWAIGSLVGAAL